ncbi:MAG TPA: hypothetical protein VMJ33_11550 [Gallionella sp.]|nr:hypothetical protein [Gallionella sp.]
MDESDIQKYVLAQATTEVEHNRSWPIKVMAFYVAIIFGIAAALIALRSDICSVESCPAKPVIGVAVLILAVWTLGILWKTHKNYLKYRNLQVFNQKKLLEKRKDEFGIPDQWFKPLKIRASTRFWGWGFYACIVVMTAALLIIGMWQYI